MKPNPFTSNSARALHDKARKKRALAEVKEIETRSAHEAAEVALDAARNAEHDAFEALKEAWETETADRAARMLLGDPAFDGEDAQ